MDTDEHKMSAVAMSADPSDNPGPEDLATTLNECHGESSSGVGSEPKSEGNTGTQPKDEQQSEPAAYLEREDRKRVEITHDDSVEEGDVQRSGTVQKPQGKRELEAEKELLQCGCEEQSVDMDAADSEAGKEQPEPLAAAMPEEREVLACNLQLDTEAQTQHQTNSKLESDDGDPARADDAGICSIDENKESSESKINQPDPEFDMNRCGNSSLLDGTGEGPVAFDIRGLPEEVQFRCALELSLTPQMSEPDEQVHLGMLIEQSSLQCAIDQSICDQMGKDPAEVNTCMIVEQMQFHCVIHEASLLQMGPGLREEQDGFPIEDQEEIFSANSPDSPMSDESTDEDDERMTEEEQM